MEPAIPCTMSMILHDILTPDDAGLQQTGLQCHNEVPKHHPLQDLGPYLTAELQHLPDTKGHCSHNSIPTHTRKLPASYIAALCTLHMSFILCSVEPLLLLLSLLPYRREHCVTRCMFTSTDTGCSTLRISCVMQDLHPLFLSNSLSRVTQK